MPCGGGSGCRIGHRPPIAERASGWLLSACEGASLMFCVLELPWLVSVDNYSLS
jgi:hypothetical protein